MVQEIKLNLNRWGICLSCNSPQDSQVDFNSDSYDINNTISQLKDFIKHTKDYLHKNQHFTTEFSNIISI